MRPQDFSPGQLDRPVTMGQDRALRLNYSKAGMGGKPQGTKEENGRETIPAGTPPGQAGQSKILELKNRERK